MSIRIRWIEAAAGAALLLTAGVLAYAAAAWADAPVVPVRLLKVSAKRFEFIPSQLNLKKGQTVELELSTQDVLMGFNAPAFATRADIVPGQTVRVRFTPQQVGTFPFLCDIFCGSGHEDMSGTIVVTE
jgi:cytochrome c oxidase subunit 2